ncbi:MAG: HAD-IIB family hydrolase [Desulfosarcinaceae bacterium]|nr:HAD-IIB family hydrolase [Desulfosarcinaceae bacterium]
MSQEPLYIQMFSLHGLVRAANMELGRNADTGGQVKYVIELCDQLSRRTDVARVDLFTRLIRDKSVSEDYAQPVEVVSGKFRIVRIQCGGRKYLRKERLWPHLEEFIDKTIKFIKRQERLPDIFHGHYADAGYVAMQLARLLGCPFVFTGHSLGMDKRRRLQQDGMSDAEMIKRFKIDLRIRVEAEILKCADLIVASTRQEVNDQYGAYKHGRLPKFKVIPPGIDIERFYPFYHDTLAEGENDEQARYAQAYLIKELDRFFAHPDRPLVLSLCRPDKRKNISGLVKAFGEDLELQAMANLAIFAGLRKDIDQMAENERDVLTRMLLLLDKYDLYGKMAIPKRHDFEYEVPALYRITAEKRGVFINPALTEPFGLTLLEAAATGLPVVATEDGGPIDIIQNCENGILVDPTDTRAIGSALKRIISDTHLWNTYSRQGLLNVREHYTWRSHAASYAAVVKKVLADTNAKPLKAAVPKDAIGRRLMALSYFLITDIDNTLLGDDNEKLAELVGLLDSHRGRIGFAVATGRTKKSAVEILDAHGIRSPDVIISSVGAEIYYGPQCQYGQGWHTHIAYRWQREKIVDLLKSFDFLVPQPDDTQREFKISYDMAPDKDRLARIHDRLLRNGCRYQLIYSHDRYLDILPYRASKGKAIRYLSYKWELPLRNFLVCGDSGNDEEMLKGPAMAVVVGNHSPELAHLQKKRGIYFATSFCAGGILEGMRHYRFLENALRE